MPDVSWLEEAISLLAGVGIGLLGACWLTRRAADHRPAPGGDAERLALAALALEHSRMAHAVLDGDGRVRLANPRAVELGVIRSGIAQPDIVAAAARTMVSGEVVDLEFVPGPDPARGLRRREQAVHAAVRGIGDGLVLVAALDDTEAARLEAVRRDFVANVSHELKTPVAAISLLAEAIGDACEDAAAVRRFGERLEREATRMATMVRELIILSRLQGADPLPDLAVVEVDGVVDEAVARTSTVAERAGIALVIAPPRRLLVLGDREMLVTALTNLIDNAVHYSAAGTTVSISSAVRENHTEISVTDRGIGIAAEFHDRVFERFFRVDPARSRATGGTGLGLAIVKHVAANHGGTAVVWSRPGTGSTFTLRLPAYLPQPVVDHQPTPSEAHSQ